MNGGALDDFDHLKDEVAAMIELCEEEYGVPSEDMLLDVMNDQSLRDPRIVKWLVSYRIFKEIDAVGTDSVHHMGDGYGATQDWVFRLQVYYTNNGARVSTAEMHKASWLTDESLLIEKKHFFYGVDMWDTELPVFFYDSFFGPLVRQDFSEGKITATEYAGEGKAPPPLLQILAEADKAAEERRLF